MSTLVDVDGRPIDMKAIREPQTARVGHLQREFEAHPSRGLTPERLNRIMVAAEQGDLVPQVDLADDMEERDAHIYAELGKRRGFVNQLDWDIEPPEGATPAEEKLARQVKDWLQMIEAQANGVTGGLSVLLGTMTDAILKGYSAQELVWDYVPDASSMGSGRKVMLPRATWHPQRWFTTSADRRRFLLRSRQMTEATDELPAVMGEELLPYAWLMHVHPARNGYLARGSLARVLVWPYLFKNYAVRDLAEFLEIYGLPLRLGKYPTGAGDAEKLALLQAVTQIGHNAAGIIPQSMQLEFEAAAAGTEVPFAAMWDRMDAAESKAILGQTLTASEGQHGTQALGNVHNEVRHDIGEDDARRVAETITRQLIRPLVTLNVGGADLRRLPRFVFDTGEPEDLAQYAEALPKLAKAGMKIGRKWAQEKLRIPEPDDGEDVLQGPPDPQPLGQPGQTPEPGPARPGAAPAPPAAAPKPPTDARAALAALAALSVAQPGPAAEPDLIDELVAEQTRQWQPLLGPMLEPLLAELDKALAAGESLDSFATRLPELIAQLDAQPMTAAMAQAAFVSRLAGEAGLDLTRNQE
jgi:phage gp29-like protein